MATRLTVVISQAAVRSSSAADAEESLLTALMMTSGLDATLVGSLDSIHLDSTDYLCLSGFTQSLAIVSALNFDAVAEHWQRLRLPGEVTQLGSAANVASRRVYYFPIDRGTQTIVDQLQQLLIDRSVQTVNVMLPGRTPSVATQILANSQNVVVPHSSTPRFAPTPELDSSRPNRALADSFVDSTPIPESEWMDLDQLIDDFDTLDL